MRQDKFEHNFKGFESICYIFGDGVRFMMIVGHVLDVEAQYPRIEFDDMALVILCLDLEQYFLDLHFWI
jgi:hypothetical protein